MKLQQRYLQAEDAVKWARGPTRWAAKFALAHGPFRVVRRLPMVVLAGVVRLQLGIQRS